MLVAVARTAAAGQDYLPTFDTLTFADGETVKTFKVPILQDYLSEMDETVNLSLNETLSRTILTSGTTLLVVVCTYLIGTGQIKDFAFALIVGWAAAVLGREAPPLAADEPLDRREARFVGHLRALPDPVAQVKVGQPERSAGLDLPDHVVCYLIPSRDQVRIESHQLHAVRGRIPCQRNV